MNGNQGKKLPRKSTKSKLMPLSTNKIQTKLTEKDKGKREKYHRHGKVHKKVSALASQPSDHKRELKHQLAEKNKEIIYCDTSYHHCYHQHHNKHKKNFKNLQSSVDWLQTLI